MVEINKINPLTHPDLRVGEESNMSVSTCNASRMRHSLLQPAAAIRMLLSTYEKNHASRAARLNTIAIAGRGLGEFQEELEALSTFLVLEYGTPDPQIADLHLGDLITDIVTGDRIMSADAHRVRRVGDVHQVVKTDAALIRTIISALIKNALEFSDSEIEVLVRQSTDGLSLRVRDQGIGIADDLLPRLGEPFLVANVTKTQRVTRLGVGLPTAIRAAQKLGGRLEFAPNTPKGTTASFMLPLG